MGHAQCMITLMNNWKLYGLSVATLALATSLHTGEIAPGITAIGIGMLTAAFIRFLGKLDDR